MFGDLKEKLTGDKKILILMIILLFFNIALLINLFAYMIVIEHVNVWVLHDIVTIVSAIIILGFISTRLPKLKEMTDGSVYEIGYLILIGLLSLVISYFNRSTNGESVLWPYIEMFRMLSVILILTYVATKTKSFQALVKGEHSRKTAIWQIIIFSVLGILASYFTMDVNGIPANSRGLVVMISALLGGPYVGIPVGIVSGLWRFSMGGSTALACGIGTVLAGFVGSLVFKWNRGEFLKPYKATLLMLLYSGFDMFLITVFTPHPDGIHIAGTLYGPMTFAAVLGMFLFTLFLGEKKEEIESDDDLKHTVEVNSDIIDLNTERIIEISMELKEYKNRVEELENEVDELKRK